MVKRGRPQMAIQYHVIKMQFACWITKARIDTHSEYVVLSAFTQQQFLCEHASTLRDRYMAHHVNVTPVLY